MSEVQCVSPKWSRFRAEVPESPWAERCFHAFCWLIVASMITVAGGIAFGFAVLADLIDVTRFL
jgi:hypothetical protein